MTEKKRIIGVAAPSTAFDTENVYDDKYMFNNTYGKRVVNAGGIPVGLVPVDGLVSEEQLELCDAFLLCGGTGIRPYYIQTIDYAVRNHKRLLGICLGMQAIYAYFKTVDVAAKTGYSGRIVDLFCELNKDGDPFREHIEGHKLCDIMPRGREDSTKHSVYLEKGSHIEKIVGAESIMGASMHILCIGGPVSGLAITGRAADGVVEAIEHADFIIGTQFHPDVDDEMLELFRFLTE